jgi:hypothetical protein
MSFAWPRFLGPLPPLLTVATLAALACGGTVAASKPSPAPPDASSTPDASSFRDAAALLDAGGPDALSDPPYGCDCGEEGLVCAPEGGGCVECTTDDECHGTFTGGNPNAVCLPSNTCGCTADSQCAGQGAGVRCVANQCGCDTAADCPVAPACAPNHVCGCSTNADCADGGVYAATVCDVSNGSCVQCVTDSDCVAPNATVCDPSLSVCVPCRTSTDCASNGDGPTCGDLGQYTPGYGMCGCTTDSDCTSRGGGPHCVSNGSPYDKCGCTSASECATSSYGHACTNPFNDGWLQCGCTTSADCPSGKSCVEAICQ